MKYPILLVHGAGSRDKTFGVMYWGRIPKYLEKHGVPVFFGGTEAWAAIETNAKILKKKIEQIVETQKTEKVNIIAHSRGGLEARYLINRLGMKNYVASLTTISTPHHGAKIMNLTCGVNDLFYKIISFFVNTWFRILGDTQPDFFTGSRQLSQIACDQFNKDYPNLENIYYQSYAAKMKYFFSDPFFMLLNILIQISDGENDGLCPVDSAKWGNFKGVITTEGLFGISHAGIIDLYRMNYKGIHIPEFFLTIAKELGANGY